MTPYNNAINNFFVLNTGQVNSLSVTNNYGVRPSINLKSEIKVESGEGTVDNPYRLEGDNDSNLSGTLLNTRYSGEYINFGTGENNLYRIVSHETKGLTKIVSAKSLKENGTIKTVTFGDSVFYSSTNTTGSFLNGEYLTDGEYLTSEQVNMIEDNTTWYLGTVGSGVSYRLAKYKDVSMSEYATNTNAKVGLLRFGELMAGQFDRSENNVNYWTLTPYSTSHVRYVGSNGAASFNYPDRANDVYPALNLKSNVIITGGDGTKNSPFTLDLAP